MKPLALHVLSNLLTAQFPPDAKCWSLATDEVRDMCRFARILARVPDRCAIDFGELGTPAKWNEVGVRATTQFYSLLNAHDRKLFCDRFEHWFVNWMKKDS